MASAPGAGAGAGVAGAGVASAPGAGAGAGVGAGVAGGASAPGTGAGAGAGAGASAPGAGAGAGVVPAAGASGAAWANWMPCGAAWAVGPQTSGKEREQASATHGRIRGRRFMMLVSKVTKRKINPACSSVKKTAAACQRIGGSMYRDIKSKFKKICRKWPSKLKSFAWRWLMSFGILVRIIQNATPSSSGHLSRYPEASRVGINTLITVTK